MALPVAMGWPHAQLYGSVAMIAYGVVKEFWFDPRYEDIVTSGGWWGGCQDFAGYLTGVGLVNIMLCLRRN